MKCPGIDHKYWKEEDIFEVICPHCGKKVEFFRDDILRSCQKCKKQIKNPKIDSSCSTYCKFKDICSLDSGNDEKKESKGAK
ncbi:hypothetical protein ACFL1T_03470 [Chlamydiota bacterium]